MDPGAVKDVLSKARQLLDDASLPDDLRAVAFGKAVELLSMGVGAAGKDTFSGGGSVGGGPLTDSTSGLSPMDRLLARLRLSRDVVEAVYTENGDELELTVAPDKLARSKSAGAREIALLVAAAGQSVSDEPTTADQIRRVVEDYNRYDSPNFASALFSMKGMFLVAGSSRARTFKLTKPGWAAASALVSRLGGADKTAA